MNTDFVWPIFLIAIALVFAAWEGYALKTGRDTLSRWVWRMATTWPPFGWLVGLLTGFLAAHFFWPAQGCSVLPF